MPSAGSLPKPRQAAGTAGQEVVITGVGMVSPIGIGRDEFWTSLVEQHSGVRAIESFDASSSLCKIAAEVRDFAPKKYVRPRKSLKVMSRAIQLGFAAADLAVEDSGLKPDEGDPERKGVLFGAEMIYCDLDSIIDAYRSCIVDGKFDFSRWGSHALASMHPLWLLKFLPNMPACHIGIAQDARGPNNSITMGDISSLLAVTEGMRVIQRQQADLMICGGTSSSVQPTPYHFRGRAWFTHRNGDPATVCRPFDAGRDGSVIGEGAAAFVLESRQHAEARGATVLARVLGYASKFEPVHSDSPRTGEAIRNAISGALGDAGLQPGDIGHVKAHGLGTIEADRLEAQAIHDTLGDVPVTAPKSFFGNLGASAGATELAVSVLGLLHGEVPVTLNYEQPDPACPVNVVHGSPQPVNKPTALVLNEAPTGQTVALVIAAERDQLAS